MSRRTSNLGEGWQLRPHQLDLTCIDARTGVEVPVVQIKYGSPGFPTLTADEILRDLPDNQAQWHIDVQILLPGVGLKQVRHDPVGADGQRMIDRARDEDGIDIDGDWHEVVRYRGVIECPGCGAVIQYRVENLVRLVWRMYGPGKHSMPHPALAGALARQAGAEQ